MSILKIWTLFAMPGGIYRCYLITLYQTMLWSSQANTWSNIEYAQNLLCFCSWISSLFRVIILPVPLPRGSDSDLILNLSWRFTEGQRRWHLMAIPVLFPASVLCQMTCFIQGLDRGNLSFLLRLSIPLSCLLFSLPLLLYLPPFSTRRGHNGLGSIRKSN